MNITQISRAYGRMEAALELIEVRAEYPGANREAALREIARLARAAVLAARAAWPVRTGEWSVGTAETACAKAVSVE